MDTFLRDLRHAARSLGASRAVSVIAVLVLAVGIGAGTTIFSFVNAVLVRPLPYGDADRIVALFADRPKHGVTRSNISFADFEDLTAGSRAFEAASAYISAPTALSGLGEPERLERAIVSPDFFRVLRVPPALGRTLLPEDASPTPHAAVLSYGLWARRFGSDPAIVGRTLTLNGRPYTVVGIMPRAFRHPEVDVWTPLDPQVLRQDTRDNRFLQAVARLHPGASLERAQAELETVARRLEREHPESNTGWRARVRPLHADLAADLRSPLVILLAAVAFVLLISCANVANLLLARGASRQREVAVRIALGASRGRLVRQFLTESLLLAGVGGGLGILLSMWGTRLLRAAIPVEVPAWIRPTIDGRVLAFTVIVSLLTGALFGIVPSLHASRPELNAELKQGGRGGTAGLARSRLRGALVIVEVALSLVLLAGAALLIGSFVRMQRADPGFDPRGVLALRVSLPAARYGEDVQRAAFFAALLERVRGIPGVGSAAAVATPPMASESYWTSVSAEGRPAARLGDETYAHNQQVTPRYFRTMRVPLAAGRDVAEQDAAGATPVALVSETLAHTFWPGSDPLGKRFRLGGADSRSPWLTVIGVVRDTRQFGIRKPAPPEIYQSALQLPPHAMTLVVRASCDRTPGACDPAALAPLVRAELAALDPALPSYDVATMEQVVARNLWQPRLYGMLLGAFAAVAVLLAAVGLYGVISYAVTQRTKEIGVRMALGARPRDVLRLVVGEGWVLTAIGIGVGLAGALVAARALAGMLFGVSPSDPATFLGIAALLAAVALFASYIPARRASRVDPVIAMRND
ncbi:MAG: ABC transporter permease [Gemmatimonadaceae bacterium]